MARLWRRAKGRQDVLQRGIPNTEYCGRHTLAFEDKRMEEIDVHAGDFWGFGTSSYRLGCFNLRLESSGPFSPVETISASQLECVEVATEESVERLGGRYGRGMLASSLFGPLGLLAILCENHRAEEITFVARFNDGRKLLATTDDETYTEIQTAFSRDR